MPPKKPQKTGLRQFFAKQQQEKYQKSSNVPSSSTNNDIDDDSCQVVFEKQMSGSSNIPKWNSSSNTPKNTTRWTEILKKSSEKAGKDFMNPFLINVGSSKKDNDRNSKSDLLANGFDRIHGSEIFYPIDQLIRDFEINLLKCAAASNCCIALPPSAQSTSGQICAMTVFNFLKWFPRCRVLLVGSSDSWSTSLCLLGLKSQITKLTTLTQFKNLKEEPGRIILCTTPQCALKVVESSEASEFLDEFRLVLVDLKPNECCTKYKPILNVLTRKDVFFRCVVLTTSTSDASRRTASITKRQQMITNLHLSDWIEQSEADFGFRSSNIPAGVEVKIWRAEENSAKLQEIIQNFEMFCENPINDFARRAIIPSKSIRKLIWTSWKSLKQSNPSNTNQLEVAEFLTVSYKLLIIDGVVAARHFVKEHLEKPSVQDYATKILESSIFGGFSEFPTKFQHLLNSIEAFLKMDNHVLGVILCRDSNQAIEIQNYLELQLSTRCTFVRIIEEGTPPARNLWPIQRVSTVFIDRKSPKIVIFPVKLKDFIGYADGLPLSGLTFIASISRETLFTFRRFSGAYLLLANEPLEKLRKEDGRLVVEDRKFGKNDGKNASKLGAVERYDFKFESSRLRIDVSHMLIQFFYPRQVGSAFDETVGISRLGKTHIEMTSKEYTELYQRLQNTDFSGFQRQKKPFWVLEDLQDPSGKNAIQVEEMDDIQVCWNQDLQYLGEIKYSKLSERFTKYIKDEPIEWIMSQKRRFEYVNEITSSERLLHLDCLLKNLDAHFKVLSR